MPRLIHPTAGTVVSVEGDLETHYRAAGWGSADAEPEQVEAPSDKPRTPTRRKSSK